MSVTGNYRNIRVEHCTGAWAERKTKRSGPKSQTSGAERWAGVEKNERSGRSRIGTRAPLSGLNLSLMAACYGTSRLDFKGGNPTTFFQFAPIITQMINRGHCVTYLYIQQALYRSLQGWVYNMSQKERRHPYFRYNFVYKQPIFLIFTARCT